MQLSIHNRAQNPGGNRNDVPLTFHHISNQGVTAVRANCNYCMSYTLASTNAMAYGIRPTTPLLRPQRHNGVCDDVRHNFANLANFKLQISDQLHNTSEKLHRQSVQRLPILYRLICYSERVLLSSLFVCDNTSISLPSTRRDSIRREELVVSGRVPDRSP